MPLTIAMLTALAMLLLDLGAAAALLLGASLAPTDPVLASDVQVGAPSEAHEDETRFTLTSEAGLNDGMAFPFLGLAIVLATGGLNGGSIAHWLAVDVFWKIAVGVVCGAAMGAGLGWITFHMPAKATVLARTGDGFVALGAACLVYGVVQIADGYGFIGVFAAAVALRASHPGHEYHARMHDYAEELERLLMMVLLLCFGGALVGGGLLQGLSWPAAAFSLIALLVVRPLSGWVGTMGSGRSAGERAVVSFFGIRGLGTIYYLAYALRHASFGDTGILWATASVTVLVSIVMHGTLVTPSLRRLDQAGRHQGTRTATDARFMRERFSVVIERMVLELQWVPCIGLEQGRPDNKTIMASKSFGRPVKLRHELAEAVATYTARAAEKLRRQGLATGSLMVFATTNRHKPQEAQYYGQQSVQLSTASADTPRLVKAAMRGLTEIWRPGYRYKKPACCSSTW